MSAGIAIGIAALQDQIDEHKRLARFHRRRAGELSRALVGLKEACEALGLVLVVEAQTERSHSRGDQQTHP